MSCESVKKDLLDYIDGGLEASRALMMKKHLEDCGRCRHEYEKILKAWEALDAWEDPTPPGHLQKNIIQGIGYRRKTQWWQRAVAAAAVLIVTAAFFLFRGTDTGKHRELTAGNTPAPVQLLNTDISEENEDDIIANLHLLREKEFYDSLDELEKIDYLPLVGEPGNDDEKEQRGSLGLLAA